MKLIGIIKSNPRYERLHKLDYGDLWWQFREGNVSIEDIGWYANENAESYGHHGNAGYHFERLADHYQEKGQDNRANALKEKAIKQFLLDDRAWEAALLCLGLGQIDRVQSLYPHIREWSPYHIGVLERRIKAHSSGDPKYMSIL